MNIYVILLIIGLILIFYFRQNIKEKFENVVMTNGLSVSEESQDKIKIGGSDVITQTITGKSNTEWISTGVNSNIYYPVSYFVKGDWKVKMKNENNLWYVFIYDTTYEKLSIDVTMKITFINRKSIN